MENDEVVKRYEIMLASSPDNPRFSWDEQAQVFRPIDHVTPREADRARKKYENAKMLATRLIERLRDRTNEGDAFFISLQLPPLMAVVIADNEQYLLSRATKRLQNERRIVYKLIGSDNVGTPIATTQPKYCSPHNLIFE